MSENYRSRAFTVCKCQQCGFVNQIKPNPERRKEVTDLIIQGLTNKEIADRLKMSLSNVKTHASKIYRLYGTTTRAAFLVQYFKDSFQNRAQGLE